MQPVKSIVRYQNYLFFSITVIAVLVFLLDSSKGCDEAIINFCTISIFIIVFIVSLGMLMLLTLLTYDVSGGYFKYKSVRLFFLEDINLKQVAVIPVGLLGVFIVSYMAIVAQSPLAGIIGSGLIMGSIFLYVNSAMPVIVIHGLYNSIVVFLRSQQLTLFSTSPISVPDISFQVFNQQVINEILTQILLVAPAEELFKIFMMTVFLIIIKLRFDYSGIGSKVISMILATVVWALYHLQISLS